MSKDDLKTLKKFQIRVGRYADGLNAMAYQVYDMTMETTDNNTKWDAYNKIHQRLTNRVELVNELYWDMDKTINKLKQETK